jgi:hypothetical protein
LSVGAGATRSYKGLQGATSRGYKQGLELFERNLRTIGNDKGRKAKMTLNDNPSTIR